MATKNDPALGFCNEKKSVVWRFHSGKKNAALGENGWDGGGNHGREERNTAIKPEKEGSRRRLAECYSQEVPTFKLRGSDILFRIIPYRRSKKKVEQRQESC